MISVCTVILSRMEEYIEVLSDTLCRHTKHVREVIFSKVDSLEVKPDRCWEQNGISFKISDCPVSTVEDWQTRGFILMVAGHALGLHHGIERSKEDYIWFTDPDVFLFTSVDEMYLQLMQKHNLGIVGISHFTPEQQSYLDFPCVTNCMVKRGNLPPNNWIDCSLQSGMRVVENCKTIMRMSDKYLVPGPICPELFPNPDGLFDVGCNLWRWAHEQNWRWLSFYMDCGTLPNTNDGYGFKDLVYPMNYNTSIYRTNFNLMENLGNQDILYHRTMSVGQSGESYKQLYASLIDNI